MCTLLALVWLSILTSAPATACRYVSGDYDYAVCEYDVNFSPYVVGSLSPSILTH